MKRLQIPQKLVYIFTYTKKIYIHEIAEVNLLPEKRKKNNMSTKRPHLNRDGKSITIHQEVFRTSLHLQVSLALILL